MFSQLVLVPRHINISPMYLDACNALFVCLFVLPAIAMIINFINPTVPSSKHTHTLARNICLAQGTVQARYDLYFIFMSQSQKQEMHLQFT